MDNIKKRITVKPNSLSFDVMAKIKLSPDQHKFYQENGYLVLNQVIDFSTLYACKKRFKDVCNGIVDKGYMTVMKEIRLMDTGLKGEALINKFQDIVHDDVFSTYTENPVLLDVVSQLVHSENLTAITSMLINKPPGSGRHPPHQDMFYFMYRPAEKIIATWTAIDEVTKENGCLFVVPGSHKCGEVLDHKYPNEQQNIMFYGISEEEKQAPTNRRVDLEMQPGDTVFFHPLIIHGSRPNVSKGYRKAVTCHYAANECEIVNLRGTNQDVMVKDLEKVVMKYGAITIEDIWKFKSKHVKGVKCNL